MQRPLANGGFCALSDFFSFKVGHGIEATTLVALVAWLLFLLGLISQAYNNSSRPKECGGLNGIATSIFVAKMGLFTSKSHPDSLTQ